MSAYMGLIDLPGPAPVPYALLDRLAEEMQSVCRQPIDVLQVAALLETSGITDHSAMQRYGHASVFDLAESVVLRFSTTTEPARSDPSGTLVPEPRRQAAMDYLRGPLTLIPMVLLSVLIMVYQQYGQWSSAQVLAFSLSMVGSLLVTSGFVQAASRKGSSYLSQGYILAARRIVGLVVGLGLVTVCLAAVVLAIAVMRILAAPLDAVVTMTVAFVVLSCFWLAAGVLFMLGQAPWFGVGLAVGVGLIYVTLRGLATLSGQLGWAVLAATFIGCSGALLVMALVIRRTLARHLAASPVGSHRVVLPAAPHLVVNLAPYFAYGVLYVVLVLSGHISGWLASTPPGADRMVGVTATEVGLTIALGGTILTGGVAERTIARFWRLVKVYQLETPPAQPSQFASRLCGFFGKEYLRFALVLSLCSMLVIGAVLSAVTWTQARGVVALPWTRETSVILALGVIGYGIMALGVFQCMFMITLSRPGMANRAVIIGIVTTLTVGVIVGQLASYPYSVLGVVAGSLAFAVAARSSLRNLMHHADYFYFASF